VSYSAVLVSLFVTVRRTFCGAQLVQSLQLVHPFIAWFALCSNRCAPHSNSWDTVTCGQDVQLTKNGVFIAFSADIASNDLTLLEAASLLSTASVMSMLLSSTASRGCCCSSRRRGHASRSPGRHEVNITSLNRRYISTLSRWNYQLLVVSQPSAILHGCSAKRYRYSPLNSDR